MSVSYKVIGRHIQEARKRMKLTQREIAEKLNMSDTYYGKIERGECRANLERLAQISVLLNVPLEDLISGCMENAVQSSADNPQKLSLASQFRRLPTAARRKAATLCCAFAEILRRLTENKILIPNARSFERAFAFHSGAVNGGKATIPSKVRRRKHRP